MVASNDPGERKRGRSGGRDAWGRRGAAADALLAFTVVGSMLAIGTVYPGILIVVAVTVGIALAIAIGGPISTLPPRANAPALVAVALAFYTLFQAMPLPVALLTKLAPLNADVWRRAFLPLGLLAPNWATVSLDPGASYVEVLKWLVYAGVFVLAAWASARRGAAWGVSLVFGSAVFLSLVTLGHGLANATTVFGLYKPHAEVAVWHISPLLNPNNLAGYLNLGAMCGLALLLARRSLVPRWVVGLGVASIVGVNVLSASRAGFVALPLGVAIFAFVLRAPDGERTDNVSRRAFPWLLGAAVGGGAILAFLGSTQATSRDLYDKNLEKLAVATWVRPLVRDHFWLGIGRGAFESVFPAYRTIPGNIVFTHAENFPAQWTSEWGVPVAAVAMGVLAWLFRPNGMRIRHSSIIAGAWIGVLIVLVQNMLDLALELPAVSIALAATLGSIWGDYKRRRVSRRGAISIQWRGSSVAQKGATVGMALVLSGILWATARTGVHEVGTEKDDLYRAFLALDVRDPPALRSFREKLGEAIGRHPAEPYFPLLGGLAAKAAKDSNPVPWIQRTLERAAFNGAAHLLLADVLAGKRATNQALMELRFAANDEPGLAVAAAGRALALTRDFDDLLRAVPPGTGGMVVLENMAAQAEGSKDGPLRERLEHEALVRDPSRPWIHRALAKRLIQRIGSKDTDACNGAALEDCEKELRQHLLSLDRAFPNRSDADYLRANLLLAKGRPEQAERLLADRCDHVEDRGACLQARLTLAAQVPGSHALAAAARDVLASGCGSLKECAALATWIGELMLSRGEWGGASAYLARATRDEPTEDRWLKLAQAASQLGSHAQAADALERVGQIRGHRDPDLDAQILAHRAKALGLFDK